ncbi:MAG: hypothetical protein RMJ87_02180 [Cytophagales bacterium]|nr:hypothetical protein [Bernardetiaceae bacterium]MDW8203812.1 hypothetical protein [Cytophagales bacterium]
MKKYLSIALISLVALGMSACGEKKTNQDQTATASSVQLRWKIENLGTDSMGYAPVSRLTLLVNGKEEPLGEFSQPLEEIPEDQFKEKGIPADASIACGGFGGGSATNYYAVVMDDEIVIFVGRPNENKETAEQQPFIYEIFQTIKWR